MRKGSLVVGEDATANTIARFEHDYLATCTAELTGGSKSCRPSTNDQYRHM
jgi:hypothetical protein